MLRVRGAQLVVVVACLVRWGAVAAPALQTTVGGRHVDLDAALSIREVFEENGSTTHERTLEDLRVRAGAALTDWLRFDSTTTGTNGGPTLKSDRAGVYTWDDVFQDVSPAVDFEEAYVDVFLSALDLRIGKQKVAWGKLDRTQPNDLINPLSYSDPFLQEEEERKIGVPAVQASYFLPSAAWVPPESRLTAVWVPTHVPYRFPPARCDVQGTTSHCDTERWFPPAALPPTVFHVPAGIPLGNGQVTPAFSVPLNFRVHNDEPAAWRLADSAIGVRYSALVHDVDLALYYFHGFDPQPAFRLQALGLAEPDATSIFPPGLKVSGLTTLSPQFQQIDSWGADFAYALDPFTVRGEGAFVRGRPFPQDLRNLITDPTQLAKPIAEALHQLLGGATSAAVPLPEEGFVIRDSVEWGVGSDYVYKQYTLLLQLEQTDVLHNDTELLIKDVETRLLANLRASFLADTLRPQLVALHAIESDYTIVRPRVVYQLTDRVAAEVGYLFIAGRQHSVGGQYRRNDEGFVRLEYKL